VEWFTSFFTFRCSLLNTVLECTYEMIQVNDISGGTLDHAMLATVAELNVPYVISHMVLGLSLCKHLLFISHNDLFFISMACSILIRFTTSPFLEIAGLYVCSDYMRYWLLCLCFIHLIRSVTLEPWDLLSTCIPLHLQHPVFHPT